MENYKNSWKDHFENETLIEEIGIKNSRVFFIEVKNHTEFIKYKFRMFAFNSNPSPFLILNLETSDALAPLYCLGRNEGVFHENLGVLSEEMTYPNFKKWALDMLEEELSNEIDSAQNIVTKIPLKVASKNDSNIDLAEKRKVIETLSEMASILKAFSNEALAAFDEINEVQASFWTTIKTLFGYKTDYERFQIIATNLEAKSEFLAKRLEKDAMVFASCNDKDIGAFFLKIETFSKNLYGFCRLLNMRQMISFAMSKGGNYSYSEFAKLNDGLAAMAINCRELLGDLSYFERELNRNRI